jgi:DNA-binding response OmpR family regulator
MSEHKTKLLVIDDEPDLLAELKPLLERAGYEVATANDGLDGLNKIDAWQPDLLILDVMMPHLNGRELLRRVRAAENWTPVILLTKVGGTTDRALSLQEGADDYINKPFDPFELLARIQAVLRRTQQGQFVNHSHRLRCGPLLIDRTSRQVWVDDESVTLTSRAFGVLEYLMDHAGEVISREQLLDKVWGWSYAVETRAVDMRIAELRKALDDDPTRPQFVETVIGQGYRFLGQVRRL